MILVLKFLTNHNDDSFFLCYKEALIDIMKILLTLALLLKRTMRILQKRMMMLLSTELMLKSLLVMLEGRGLLGPGITLSGELAEWQKLPAMVTVQVSCHAIFHC